MLERGLPPISPLPKKPKIHKKNLTQMHAEGVSLIDCFTPTTNKEEEKQRPFSQESSLKVRESKN